MVFLASLSATLACLVREDLPPYPFVLTGLSVGGLLLAFPLFSDLGALLRHDEAGEWVAALPAHARERTLARVLHVLILLGALVAAWSVPWALCAPPSLPLAARMALPALGFSLAVFLAAVWAWIQQSLIARLERALLWVETALVVLVVVVLIQILGHLPEMAGLTPDRPALLAFPPAWFARPLTSGGWTWCLPILVVTTSFGSLLALPEGAERTPRRLVRGRGWTTPLSRLATKYWVRADERGPFELVITALPREREFALRTFPMLGIPLAFLWISARGSSPRGDSWRSDLLALLLLTVGVYLPLFLTHVPLTESSRAAWVLRTAPIPRSAITNGAIKALFVRWILPLYLVLMGLGLILAEAPLLGRLWLPSLLLTLLLLRMLYGRCVKDLPLSTAPEDLRSDLDWAGAVSTLAVLLPLLAVVGNRWLGWGGGLAIGLALAVLEGVLDRRHRLLDP